jgi:hypothetical protein
VRVYRWDLDKTYLDTDFESLRGIVRTATEPAHKKRALPGAAALLRALGTAPGASVMVVSGSPTQMRGVLSEKLRLDGIPFDELVLKDNVGNIRRGRFRAVKGQLGFKLPALLSARARTEESAKEVLFGDDVEADALVYSLYADVVAGHVGAAELSRVMEMAGAYPDEIDRALESAVGIAPSAAVERVFIRQERGIPVHRLAALGPRVVPIRSWWQAALVLQQMGHLDARSTEAVMLRVFDEEGRDPWVMGALAQDVARRGWVEPDLFSALTGPDSLVEAVHRAVSSLGGRGVEKPPALEGSVDYLELLKTGAWTKHGRAE